MPHQGLNFYVIGAMAALLSVATAFTVDATAAGEAEARYARERAACTDGSSHQDRATCLKEAGAALGEARGGRLGTGATATETNATARCHALPAKDRSDCIARIQGAGTTSGSVKEGGIYRELVTRTPAPPATNSETTPSAAPAASQD
jgi:hypothetical protein